MALSLEDMQMIPLLLLFMEKIEQILCELEKHLAKIS